MAKAFSIEDGNLNAKPITTSLSRTYKDLDLSFEKNTAGDVYTKKDAAAVKQAIKNLLLTNRNEKPFAPTFGGDLYGQLFELSTSNNQKVMRDLIVESIRVYEPRARVEGIDFNIRPDNYSMSVTVKFRVIATNTFDTINVNLVRLR